MKEKTWDNPNKMHFECDHKEFARQTDIISAGNIIANTEFGQHIRSWNDKGEGLVDYPENTRKPGHLFLFDIKSFYGLPSDIYDAVKQLAMERESGMWLYEFRHFRGRARVVHGYILTDSSRICLGYWVTGPTWKSQSVIAECMKYVVS